jgi:acetyltransferase-like isoleucine patch superfamily enzyme
MNLKHSLADLLHYIRWSRKFHAFGWGSHIVNPDSLHKTEAISIGRSVMIGKGARIEAVGKWDRKEPKIVIGDGTSIQGYFHCGAAASVRIGRDVLIAGRVYISDHDHVYDDAQLPPARIRALTTKPVVIGDGTWLGEGCVILKGVTIGERAVVGANAVVICDVLPLTVVGGVPARLIQRVKLSK